MIRNKSKQIAYPYVGAGLRQQGRDLTAVMGLMVEEVHEQVEKTPACGYALHIFVIENVIEIGFGNRSSPRDNNSIQPPSIFI